MPYDHLETGSNTSRPRTRRLVESQSSNKWTWGNLDLKRQVVEEEQNLRPICRPSNSWIQCSTSLDTGYIQCEQDEGFNHATGIWYSSQHISLLTTLAPIKRCNLEAFGRTNSGVSPTSTTSIWFSEPSPLSKVYKPPVCRHRDVLLALWCFNTYVRLCFASHLPNFSSSTFPIGLDLLATNWRITLQIQGICVYVI